MRIRIMGGLTAKMHSIVSLMTSKYFNNIEILWEVEDSSFINCFFTDLFENDFPNIIDNVLHLSESEKYDLYNSYTDNCVVEDYENDNTNCTSSFHILKCKDTKDLSEIEMRKRMKKKTSLLRPLSNIQSQIDKYTHLIDDNTYGVHMRIGHYKTTNMAGFVSPFCLFVETIEKIISVNKNARFLVMCDLAVPLLELHYLFPNHVLYLDRCFFTLNNGVTLEGCERIVVDLYLLSKCKRIITSRRSGFSLYASMLGEDKIEEINIFDPKRDAFSNALFEKYRDRIMKGEYILPL